jgi:hypothetical protein
VCGKNGLSPGHQLAIKVSTNMTKCQYRENLQGLPHEGQGVSSHLGKGGKRGSLAKGVYGFIQSREPKGLPCESGVQRACTHGGMQTE